MKHSLRSRFSSGSSESMHLPNGIDEFKQRSFQNSQILSQYKRKEYTKKSNDDYKSTQNRKSRFTSSTSLNKSSISQGNSRAPLKQKSAYEINSSFNNFDLITKNKDRFDFSQISANDSDIDDFNIGQSYDLDEIKPKKKNDNERNIKMQTSKAPHVSFSEKIRPSQSGSSSFDNVDENLNSNGKEKGKQSDAKINMPTSSVNQPIQDKESDIEMPDKIAMLEKKNIVLMSDLRENCQLLSSIQKRLDQSTKDMVTKSNEIVSLKKQIAELKAKAEKSNDATDKKEDQKDETEDQAKEKLQQLQQINEELIKNKEELAKENEIQKQAIEKLISEKESLSNQIKDFKSQKEEFTKQISKCRSEIEDLKLQETENEHGKELDSLISELKKKNKDSETELSKLQQENQKLLHIKNENDKLKADIFQYQKEIEILNENQKKLLIQNENLQKRVKELEEMNEKEKFVNNFNNSPENYKNKVSSASNGKMYDVYTDLSENESDENNSFQDIEAGAKQNLTTKLNHDKDCQQLQQQCIIDDFESQSYASDFSSEFSFTDASDRNEILNSPKASIIQQLISANQKNKALREANAKLESVAATVMSDYTEALNKIQALHKKAPLSIDSTPTFVYENDGNKNEGENSILQQKIDQMEVKLRKLNDSYTKIKSAHSESFSNFIRKREEFYQKEVEEMNKLNSEQSEQYEKLQNQLDSFFT